MNLALLQKEVQEFLVSHITEKATTIALKKSPFKNISSQELAQQLVGKQKAKNKLPTWFKSLEVYYPPSLNLEQTSSEKTAKYKACLISGETIIDCTGGFGIDCVAFSKTVKKVIHCELNTTLQSIAAHNFKALKATNIHSINNDGIKYALLQEQIDCIYIDPSRRNDSKGKVFFLEDCTPNVPLVVDQLLEVANTILIKTAPILDISVGIEALQYVKEIHVIAVHNEVKELLWILTKEETINPKIKAVTIFNKITNTVSATLGVEEQAVARFTPPKRYLYEPYASVMKLGVFNWIAQQFKVCKLHSQTHLYTSEELLDFPGRRFKIKAVYPFNKSGMRPLIKTKTNVVTRNFKMSVADLRKKYKLQEGLDRYLFFVTDCNEKSIVIDCLKNSN